MSCLCGSCHLSKSSRFPLSRVESSSSHVLDLIYTDYWGPTHIHSFNGYQYIVIFVEDFSRFVWYFPMRLKTNIYAIFEHFQTNVERLFSCKIKSIQSDLGAEYKKLDIVFTQLGIFHCQSCAYTHEQNGRVECRHHHIVETGLALMAQASVPS